MNNNTPTREDLIELGYLKPGDTLARAPKRERRMFLIDADFVYADRHGLNPQEMREFKKEVNTPEIKIEECTDSCCNPPEGSDWWNDH